MRFFWNGADTRNGGQKQTLPLDPARPDLERVRRDRLERNIQEIIQQALAEQRARVLEKVPESPEAFVAWAAQDLEQVLRRGEAELTKSELYDALRRALVASVDLGVWVAVNQLENVGLGFDWTLANNQARAWAEQYVGQLVTAITETTRDSVRRSVGAWVVSGEPLSALIAELSPTFGPERAELIGSTEVTRAFAEGNRRAYLESGVVTRWVWRTAADERVCFPAWTLVETQVGAMPIQDIKPGIMVWTRKGLRQVVAVSKRSYCGPMITVQTDDNNKITSTADHPFWTLEQGWLEGCYLNARHTLQTFGNQLVKVRSIFNFMVGNATYTPPVLLQILSLTNIPFSVPVPVSAIDFQGNSQFDEQEIHAVSPHLSFLNILKSHGIKHKPNSFFNKIFSLKRTIAGKTTKLSVHITGKTAELGITIPAGNKDRRPSTFFRTKAVIKVFSGAKDFPAPFTRSISCFGGSTFSTANSIPISSSSRNFKSFATNWTNFGHHLRGTGNFITFSTAISSALSYLAGVPIYQFTTSRTCQDFSRACKFMVTIIRAKDIFAFTTVWTNKFLFTIRTNIFWHSAQFLSGLSLLYHRLFTSTIDVYDLQIEGESEFYANGILVHNCPICGPLEGATVAIGTAFNGFLPDDIAQRVKQQFDAPPAHPRCRCFLAPEVSNGD